MMKKTTTLLVMVLAIAFLGFAVTAFGLPKAQKGTSSTTAPAQKTTVTPQKVRPSPVILDDEEVQAKMNGLTFPAGRYLGPSRLSSASVPFVNVRVGIPETPGGNNHMRPQVAIGPAGQIHMVYGVFHADSDGIVRDPVDSNRNGLYFYNAYNCDGGDTLRFANSDPNRFGLEMSQVFGSIGDPRPRKMQLGGILVPPTTSVPVVYGNRLIERTDLGAGFFSRRGWATMRDGASCLGLFSMDTSNTITAQQHPVMYAVNESTWVATFRDVSFPENVNFHYTTDRGATWTANQVLPTNSPWYNATTITGNGNVFYVVSTADPADPTAFQTTERPVYLKGTYNPVSGAITFGTEADIVGNFEQPGYLTSFIKVGATMIGDTLHVSFTDWNNWLGNGFAGPGGHVHHAAILPDGTIVGPDKVANINIDGRLPDRSYTLFGFAVDVWVMSDLVYNPSTKVLYCLWSAPPDNGNFGWADYEATGTLACYDIFCAASPNNGHSWDTPLNITQTDHPGCDGIITPCEHEDFFVAADRTANDTIWITALVQAYPGIQESAIASGITPDPGPLTNPRDIFRLYKAPARTPVATVRGDLGVPPGDTLHPYLVVLKPRGGTFNANVRLSNIGLLSFVVDSAKLDPGLNDGFLVSTTNAVGGSFVPVAGAYDFNVLFNTSGVGPSNSGLRSGLLKAWIHSTSPPLVDTVKMNFSVFVVPTLCYNRKIRIHSGNNFTDVGSQGSIKDQAGLGMNYPFDGSDRFYDGGVAIANSGLSNSITCATGPRKVTRQIFQDKFLRCVEDGILDSTAGSGYYNLFLVSIGTDINDSVLAWKNMWEQSTHADSSDFLVQTVKVINIGTTPIDSVAMGAIYDVDVTGVVGAAEDVSGDTTISALGRTFWMGWIATNDVAIDTCSPALDMYGAVVIPGSIGNPTDFVRPRGQIMYEQVGFSYNIDCGNPNGGDTLAQRYMWNVNVLTSARDRQYDTLTGAWEDTLSPPPIFVCNADKNNGRPYRNDMGYMTVAKKVYNFPVNGGGAGIVARYGLAGLAASTDTTFSGPGETYTIIHVGSVSGLADLVASAQKGINWYANHANLQAGPRQTRLKGDLNNTGDLSPADVVAELNDVFLGIDVTGGLAVPICVADLNNTGDLSPSDVVLLLNGTFLGSGCPNCLRPCI